MIAVLDKTFDILELLNTADGHPMMLKEVVKATGISQPTCARLLQYLTQQGYVSKFGQRQGYVIGPMAKALGQGRVYGSRWGELSQILIEQLANKLEEHTLLATFQRGKRYVVARHNGNPVVNLNPEVVFENDMYTTATGRLLLAHASDIEVNAYVKKKGFPGKKWDNIKSLRTLQTRLQAIRDIGKKPLIIANNILTLIAYPLFKEEQVVAALGIACLTSTFDSPKERQAKKLALQTVQQIQETIQTTPAI